MKNGSKILIFSLLFVALVLANYIAAKLPFRIDTTSDSLYTLSPGTKALLDKMDEAVQLDLYFSKSNDAIPTQYKNYAVRVEEMLRQYVRHSKGHVRLTVIDPRADTPDEEKATAAGVSPQMLPSGEKVYFGLVATLADQQKNIPTLTPQREAFFEYDVSQLLYSVQQVTKKKLGLITSLPLRSSPSQMPMMKRQPLQDQAVIDEWEKTFEIITVEPNATELPAGLDVLAVIHPQNLSPKLQYAIDQFVLSGKATLIAVDPANQHFKSQQNQSAMFGGPQPGVSSDLPALFKAYGITYNPQNLVGDLRNASQVSTSAGTLVRYPIWITLPKEAFSTASAATAQLNTMLVVEAGSFEIKPTDGANVTTLVETSALSGSIAAMQTTFADPESLAKDIKPEGKKVIAALIHGKLKSAFPDGAPADTAPKAKDDKAPTPAPVAPGLKESTGSSNLLIVSDTDWIMDNYSVRRMNFAGTSLLEPLNDNLNFASNALELIAGSQDLVTLRGKGTAQRPFTVVKEMEVTASQKFQQKLQALESRLSDVQKQLSELQGKKGANNRLVATPEVQKAIDDFRKQEAKMRGERRTVRAELRRDIEALGNRLLIINLFAGPLGLVAFYFWFQRSRRTVSSNT